MALPFLGRRRSSSIKKEFTDKELQDLRIAFHLLDRDNDGLVSSREFKIMLNNLGIDVKEDTVERVIKNASHSGKNIDENDFLKFVKQIQDLVPTRTKEEEAENLHAAFKVFDLDEDGFISKDELRIALEMIGEDVTDNQLDDAMNVADTDRDGKINFAEFAKLLE